MQQDAASTTGPDLEQDTTALATAHRFKLRPPTFDGNYATFEEWKYKFTAYMGLMDAISLTQSSWQQQQHSRKANDGNS